MICYRQGVLHLEHCDRKDAKRRRIELSQQGYIITHTGALVAAPHHQHRW